MNIIFDPCLLSYIQPVYGGEQEEANHFLYLRETVNFIDEYFCNSIMHTDQFYNDIVRTKEHPWNQYKYYRVSMQETQKKILRNLTKEYHIVTLNDEAVCLSNLKMPLTGDVAKTFLKSVNYIANSRIFTAILLGECNHSISKPVTFNCSGNHYEVDAICNPYLESCESYLRSLTCTEKFKVNPSTQNLFPNSNFCIKHNDEFLRKMGLSTVDRISLINEYGHIIAKLNNYQHNTSISQKNSRAFSSKREVFISKGDGNIYISIDFESGGFEVFDRNQQHLGQYSFSGKQIKAPSPTTHKLLL